MSKDRVVRNSRNFKPKNRSSSSSSSRSKPNYRSSTRTSNRYDSGNRRQSDRGTQEFHTVICDKCKKETTVPFKPTGIKPVYCRDCFQDQKPRNSSSITRRLPSHSGGRPNYRSSDRSSNRYDSRERRQSDRGPVEEHTVICDNCKKETTVPFKPSGNKPVYCRDCFQEHKPQDGVVRRLSSRSSSRPNYRSSDSSRERYDARVRRQSDKGTPDLYTTTCSNCNRNTTVPFKPTGTKPVYCRECYKKLKPQDGSTPVSRFPKRSGSRINYRSSSRSPTRIDSRARKHSDRESIELHTVICDKCKKETTVPFKPTGTKPVYCKSCFQDPKLKAKSQQETTTVQDKVDEVVERFGDRPGPYRASKRMHQTTCKECKKEITVPFKPAGKPIYCQECFTKIGKKK